MYQYQYQHQKPKDNSGGCVVIILGAIPLLIILANVIHVLIRMG